MSTDEMELTLFRHGETIANAKGEWQGSTDSDLTESGKLQVIEVAKSALPKDIDLILHSGMGRSIKTAEIISDIIGVRRLEMFDLIRDRALGAGEGMTTAKIMDVFGLKFTNILDDTINLLPGAESVEDLRDRVIKARDILFSDYKGKNVLAISHGGFIRMFYKIYIGDPHSIRFTNCSFIKVRMDADETALLEESVVYL
ncbi:MAG: histidine phosphatase family protein [Candidatus Thermoplasmatota archaeon]|nr:histidine phosphatase family protein [Candidatus Thermoplasmatota archaeon]